MASVIAQALLLFAVASSALALLCRGGHVQLPLYLLGWALFHGSEYFCTSRFSPRTATASSFLIYGARGSPQLAAMHVASVGEFVIRRRLGLFVVATCSAAAVGAGAVLVVVGTVLRGRAIYDCGDSFSHYIETSGRRRLVVTGVYAWCRHPSYTGFFVYAIGMQLVVGNGIMSVLCVVVLGRFFRRRIAFEEHFLIQSYGAAYVEYRSRVRSMVPYVY